jgi:hypothetical protein
MEDSFEISEFAVKTGDDSSWSTVQARVALQLELDACFVPSHTGHGLRADTANIVALGGSSLHNVQSNPLQLEVSKNYLWSSTGGLLQHVLVAVCLAGQRLHMR